MKAKPINMDAWGRRAHFEFFKNFAEPFFGVTVEVDCSKAYLKSKEKGYNFFLFYLHKSLKAVNQVEEFTYRIEEDRVVKYGRIDPAPTVSRADGTFGFCYFPFKEEFSAFQQDGKKAMEEVSKSHTLDPGTEQNVVYYSVLPWFKFTSLSHAHNLARPDAIPRISFGKLFDQNGSKMMPMSVHVNHAIADGYHVGQYLELFQQFLDTDS